MTASRNGRGGLQLRPGEEAGEAELAWTDVEPLPGTVTCNIGGMLMRWSDDRLLSALHRVRMPRADEYLGGRAIRSRSSARPTRTR